MRMTCSEIPQGAQDTTPRSQQPHPLKSILPKLLSERWILGSLATVLALYVTLVSMKPSGEGFGRGWNLIAFWLYGSPVALVMGGIGFWRSGKTRGELKILALVVACLALCFPVVAILVMRAKS